ncbi:MAG: hypothetical protein CME65_09920 [Halobacteriovoraceae bacterium]|nr:hypothetical protein [Halobacteriovoraceae bacterium]|tara:strand:- start:6665 stop:7534 length:870 start_codon:yes stop_codon:yes gene_type:complete
MEIDLIRILCAFFCGFGLTLSGSLCQLTTNNSLASPSTLGMDGIGVGCLILAQTFITSFGFSWGIELTSLGLFFFLFTIMAFFLLKMRSKRLWQFLNLKQIILLGLAFNLMMGAIFSVLQFMFMALNYDFPTSLWFGHFKHAGSTGLIVLGLSFSFIWIYCFRHSEKFNFINLGVHMAQGMGVNVERFQKINLLLALFITGAIISFFGVFSFLGLVLPHILRSFGIFKINMRNEILWGPWIGGAVIAVVDLGCYNFIFYGAELPVGMISSVIGALSLILLSFKMNIVRG